MIRVKIFKAESGQEVADYRAPREDSLPRRVGNIWEYIAAHGLGQYLNQKVPTYIVARGPLEEAEKFYNKQGHEVLGGLYSYKGLYALVIDTEV